MNCCRRTFCDAFFALNALRVVSFSVKELICDWQYSSVFSFTEEVDMSKCAMHTTAVNIAVMTLKCVGNLPIYKRIERMVLNEVSGQRKG
jgi:hypothetical protein